jgi:nitroreductase
MDLLELIKTRRAVRKYLKKPVPWDDISNIAEAGRYAPSAGNLQNWKFIVVLDPDKRKALAEAALKQYWMETAPVHIVIIAEPQKAERYYGTRGERLYSVQNCAAAAQNMMLEAHNIGLASCWVGAFDEEMVKRALMIPPEARPQIILTIGYPAEQPEKPAKHPQEVVTWYNKWRGKIKDVPGYFGYYSVGLQKGLKKGKETVKEHGKRLIEKAKQRLKK